MSFHSVVIQKLLNTNAHIGRRVTAHHFKIFSDGTRNSVCIIDSDKTLICLRSACNFIGQMARNNARFLFVNTNALFDEIIAQMTEKIGIKNNTTWRQGGFLTNSLSPKKFRGRNKKFSLGSIHTPDCIVMFDTERKSSVIQEAYKMQIPIVGLVDSSMPWETYKKIAYPVPANDSVEFVYLFCNLITKTILKEQKDAGAGKDEKSITIEDFEEDRKAERMFKNVFPYESLQAITEDVSETRHLLEKLAVLKFNGGLGSKTCLSGSNITMEISGGLSCLDLVVNQIEALNASYGCNIPLILVNTVNVQDYISKILEKHPNKNIHSVQSQHHVEKPSSIAPSSAEGKDKQDDIDFADRAEVLLSLMKSGKLEILLSQGKEYILILSSDNLAHVIDSTETTSFYNYKEILHHLIQDDIGCCLEVMPKSYESEENKLPQNKENTRENWRFIDTMWINIHFLEGLAQRRAVQEQLSITKLLDHAMSVPKSRYLPVKSTTDLFLLQSDLYTIVEGTLSRNTARENPSDPSIELGPEFKDVNDYRRRFKSIPSIIGLDKLKVIGDVWFGTSIVLKGKVIIHAKHRMKITIPDGTLLENKIITSQADVGGGSL